MTSRTPERIVTDFLDALARGDSAAAMADVAENIVYSNVGLPTIRGKRGVAKIFGAMDKASYAGFDYRMISIATDDTVVLTERIDEIRLGRVRIRFWVCGRFEVVDGAIVVWRDYFDFLDCTKATARGLIGVVVPSAVRALPPRRERVVSAVAEPSSKAATE